MILSLANGLVDRGYTVNIILPEGANDTSFPIKAKLNLIPVNFAKPYGFIPGIFLLYKYLLSSHVAVSTYYPTTFSLYFTSLILPALRKLYLVQGYEPFFPEERLSGIKKAFAQKSYNLPVEMITNSRWLHDTLWKEHHSRSSIINPGVDLRIFSPGLKRTGRKRKILLTVGRSQKLKGLTDFIKSVELLSEKGYGIDALIITNEKLRIRSTVSYKVVKPDSDEALAGLYADADVYIHTSYSEGFGLPPIEAMACGTPVVMTDSGGVNEYGKNGINSLIVPPGNIQAIANAIAEILDNPSKAAKLAGNGLETARMFSWDNTVTKFIKVLANESGEPVVGEKKCMNYES
jgi:glycosyltransferase involved in cell wall biosynthesis